MLLRSEASEVEERFWTKVKKATPDLCWEWLGAKDRDGYGQFKVTLSPGHAKQCKAHRISFELFHGREPNGLCLHSCDNPSCVNPHHLSEGTVQDNTDDKYARGRGMAGETMPWAKLTWAVVTEIRSYPTHVSHTEIAKTYGVSVSNISRIRKGTLWKNNDL